MFMDFTFPWLDNFQNSRITKILCNKATGIHELEGYKSSSLEVQWLGLGTFTAVAWLNPWPEN